MRFVPFPVIACSLIAVILPSEGYVSGINPRLTTAEPTKTTQGATTLLRSSKLIQTRATDDDQIVFPPSNGELLPNTNTRTWPSQNIQGDHWIAEQPLTRGSFQDSAKQKSKIGTIPSANRISAYPFEKDEEDDRPIWSD